MSHELESIAWAGTEPWHGLGTRVDSCITVDDMLVAAGLDWEVTQVPCFTEIDGIKKPVDRVALVRSTDKKIMTVTSPAWNPLQNRDALEFFREYCDAGQAKLETAGSLRGGKIVWGLASVKKAFTLNGRDEVKGYILLTSPHEVGKAITVRATSVRVVCANTLAMAERGSAHYTQSHVKAFDVSKAKSMVAFTVDQVERMEMEAKALQSLSMSEFDTVRLLAKYFQPVEAAGIEGGEDRVKALINEPSNQNKVMKEVLWALDKAPGATPGNGWGVLNAVTYWSDHMAGRETDARIYRSWFGHTGARKDKVMQELLEMADAA